MENQKVYETEERDAEDPGRKSRDFVQFKTSPEGTRRTQIETYSYWPTPPGESPHAKDNRLRAKRRARSDCLLKFDPAEHAKAKEKKRRGARAKPPRPPPAPPPDCHCVLCSPGF